MAEDQAFRDSTTEIDELLADPESQEAVAAVRAEMRAADEAYARAHRIP